MPDDINLNEQEALAQAKQDGIEFEDVYTFERDELHREFATREEAIAASKGVEGAIVAQVRRQKITNQEGDAA